MVALRILVARPSVAEIDLLEDPRLFEELHRPVDRRERDARVRGIGPRMQLFHVRMVPCPVQHPRDHAPLLGQAEALLLAAGEDGLALVHGLQSGSGAFFWQSRAG